MGDDEYQFPDARRHEIANIFGAASDIDRIANEISSLINIHNRTIARYKAYSCYEYSPAFRRWAVMMSRHLLGIDLCRLYLRFKGSLPPKTREGKAAHLLEMVFQEVRIPAMSRETIRVEIAKFRSRVATDPDFRDPQTLLADGRKVLFEGFIKGLSKRNVDR